MQNPPLTWRFIFFLMVCALVGCVLALFSMRSSVGQLRAVHFITVAAAFAFSCLLIVIFGRRRK